jgi:hypothetical protein
VPVFDPFVAQDHPDSLQFDFSSERRALASVLDREHAEIHFNRTERLGMITGLVPIQSPFYNLSLAPASRRFILTSLS